MYRKREAPTSTNSMCSNGDAKFPMPIPRDGTGDDALLALEQQFDTLAREFSILLKSSATRNERGKQRNGRDAVEGSGAQALAGDETDRLAAERLEKLEAALARLAPIEQAIMATPAQTIIGLGVKARHAAYVLSECWAEPLERIDWDRRAVRLLIEAVCLVAGRPLATAEVSKQWLEVEH